MTKVVKEDGSIEYYNEQGRYHREDGPAIIWINGIQEWWFDGELHREDGPAIIEPDGEQQWYQNGQIHREDGPAIIYANGDQEWFRNDRCHREDGPAIIYANGDQEWYRNGRFHREDGPAVIQADGGQAWYINGQEVHEDLVNNLNSLTANLIHYYPNVELRSWLIARMGWPKYLREINAKPIDTRDNDVENTKEALYKVKGIKGKQLIVTCPTGRVFSLHVPDHIKTCEQAQLWLGNDTKKKYNVIGRT